MPTFQYTAKKKNAETVRGQLIADSKEAAVDKINQLGFIPVSVEEHHFSAEAKGAFHLKKVKPRVLYLFSRQLVNLLKAGVPILRTLEIISSQMKDIYFQNVISIIHHGIREGRSFSDCLLEFPNVFPSLYVMMVRVGEESGKLKETIADMANHLKQQEELSAKVRAAMTYPALMAVVGVGTLVFILTYVMPQMMGLFSGLDLPVPTVIVMKVSEALMRYWLWICAGLFFFAAVIQSWSKTRRAQMFISQMKIATPFLGIFWIKLEVSRFCRTLQLLLKNGISIVRAIQLSIPIVGNELIRQELAKCQEDLVAGYSFGKSLKKTQLIPVLVGDLIAVGEESGSLSETLGDISDSYEQDTNESIKFMTTLLEPIMILLVGSIIGFVIIAMLLPIFQMDVFAR